MATPEAKKRAARVKSEKVKTVRKAAKAAGVKPGRFSKVENATHARGVTPEDIVSAREEKVLDSSVRQKFLEAYKFGIPVEMAAAMVRVSTKTIYEVRRRGLEAGEGPDFEFAQAFAAAPGARTLNLLGTVHRAAQGGDWGAARYLLACGSPKHFSEGAIERNADIERRLLEQREVIETDAEVVADEKRRRKAQTDTAVAQAAIATALAKDAKDGKIGAVAGLTAFANDPAVPGEIKEALRAWMAQAGVVAITTRNLGAEPPAEGKPS